MTRVNPFISIPLEVNPLTPEQVNGVGGVSITRYVEIPEIEFPDESVCGAQIREVAVGVGESETHLNEIQSIYVGLEDLVVIRGTALTRVRLCRVEGRAENKAREFSVHGNEGKTIYEIADELEFRF